MIGTPAYFAARGVPRTPADLAAHQAIIYEQRDGGASLGLWEGDLGNHRYFERPTPGQRIGGYSGGGARRSWVCYGSEWVFAPELKSGAVISILDDWSLPAVDLWAVFPTGRQASVKARAFTSFIKAKYRSADLAPSGPDENRTRIKQVTRKPGPNMNIGCGSGAYFGRPKL